MRKKKIFVSVLFGLVVTFSYAEFKDDSINTSALLIAFLWPLFSFISYLFLYLISRYSFPVEHKQIRWPTFILYLLPSIVVSSIYLIAFYPGNMTVDSIVQWKQAQAILAGNWSQVSDAHPVAHTALLALLISLWHSPAALAAFNILCVSSIVAYGAYSLEKAGFSRKVVWIYVILLSTSPPFGIIVITLWKDVLFSAGLAFLTMIIMNIVISKGEYLRTFRGIFLLFIAMLMILFFRHNGRYDLVISVFLIVIIYGITDSSPWKNILSGVKIGFSSLVLHKIKNSTLVRFFATFIAALAFYLIIVNNVYNMLNISPAFEGLKYSVPLNVMAGVLKNGRNITPEQYSKAAKILPLGEWFSSYDPYLADPIKDNKNIDDDAYLKNKREFFTLLAQLCLQNPREAITAYGNITSIIWRIRGMGYNFAYTTDIDPEDKDRYGVKDDTVVSESLCPPIKSLLTVFLRSSTYSVDALADAKRPKPSPLIAVVSEALSSLWRPALLLYLSILFAVGSALVNGLRSLCIPLVVIVNNMVVALSIPAQDYRYLYCNFLCFGFVMLFSFIKFNKAT